MRLVVLLFMFLSCNVGFSQPDQKEFSGKEFKEIVGEIVKYNDRAQEYWKNGEQERSEKCRDSLTALIQKTHINNYTFETLNGSTFKMATRKKPLFIQVTASWCAPCKFEVSALNKIVEKYGDQVDFILLFWDALPGVQKLSKDYNKNIILVPSMKEHEDSGPIEISGFQHALGYPCNYLVALDNHVVSFSQGAMIPANFTDATGKQVVITAEEADQGNYKRLESEILELINK